MGGALLALLMVPPPPATPPQPPRCTLVAESQAAQPVLFPLALEERIASAYPVLIVDLDDSGSLQQASMEKSSRNRDLDRRAMEKARRWRYDCAPGDAPRLRVRMPPPTCTLDRESRHRHPPVYPPRGRSATCRCRAAWCWECAPMRMGLPK